MKPEHRSQRGALASLVIAFALCAVLPIGRAQPTGPAQIIRGASEARAQSELRKSGTPSEASAPAQGEATSPHAAPGDHAAAGDHAAHGGGHEGPPGAPVASEAPDLPTGTLEITVLDPDGLPKPQVEVLLGIMAAGNKRNEERAPTGDGGKAVFSSLPVGTTQAYRVNVFYGGAKFSSNPFRLPESGGYRVELPLLRTTHDDRALFAMIGQSVVELRDDRLHITESVRLANAGGEAYVFPEDGQLIELPPGFLVFTWQDQMSDQKATEVPGKGFKLKGSLAPGMVTLAWAYELRREGDPFTFQPTLPFRTYAYRTISEAPEGLSLTATGFPAAEPFRDDGRKLLVTEMRRTPPDPPLDRFTVKLEGIPGPGPGRWVAVVLALVLLALGVVYGFGRGEGGERRRVALSERKKELLALAQRLEAERAREQIGPEYHAQKLDEITTELALVLRDEESLAASSAHRAA